MKVGLSMFEGKLVGLVDDGQGQGDRAVDELLFKPADIGSHLWDGSFKTIKILFC